MTSFFNAVRRWLSTISGSTAKTPWHAAMVSVDPVDSTGGIRFSNAMVHNL